MRYKLDVHFANIFKKCETLMDDDSVPQISLVRLEIKMPAFLRAGLKKSLRAWCHPRAMCLYFLAVPIGSPESG